MAEAVILNVLNKDMSSTFTHNVKDLKLAVQPGVKRSIHIIVHKHYMWCPTGISIGFYTISSINIFNVTKLFKWILNV